MLGGACCFILLVLCKQGAHCTTKRERRECAVSRSPHTVDMRAWLGRLLAGAPCHAAPALADTLRKLAPLRSAAACPMCACDAARASTPS